ncbi:MAG: DUF2764 family protein [Bacteroidales bacterium]|nr:DUF2764 family protein [Bacteroidales bacterium]
MGNFEYIIASLPVFEPDKGPSKDTAEQIKDFVRSQLDGKDLALVDFLESGWVEENLDKEFYLKAMEHKNRFIREYFLFDLQMRNAKVRHLNKALDRPKDMDIFLVPEVIDLQADAALEKIYEDTDILGKERAADRLLWDKIMEITTFNYFDIDAVLGFLAKLHITQRWMLLDEETGRSLFRTLVQEVKGTFKGVEYNSNQ